MLCCLALLAWQARAAEEVLRDCSARVNDDSVGLTALEADCPGLEAALQASDAAAFIGEAQARQLTRESLLDLLTLQTRYQGQSAGPVLDPAAAKALRSLPAAPPPVKAKSMLQTLREWLEQRWSKVYDTDNWLSRLLKRIDVSPTISGWVLIAVLVVIQLVVVFLVVTVLRSSGTLTRWRKSSVVGGAPQVPQQQVDLTLADLDAVALRERAPLLFRLLVATLRRRGNLQSDRAMTHREVMRHASFAAIEQQQQFGTVAAAAERVLYGVQDPAQVELEQALHNGRVLYAQLVQPSAQAAIEPRA